MSRPGSIRSFTFEVSEFSNEVSAGSGNSTTQITTRINGPYSVTVTSLFTLDRNLQTSPDPNVTLSCDVTLKRTSVNFAGSLPLVEVTRQILEGGIWRDLETLTFRQSDLNLNNGFPAIAGQHRLRFRSLV
jgi:hypothetical protein